MPVAGQPGSGTASDVPGVYDVVINGFGYMLLASLEPNLPFRSHRAIYTFTPTFETRANVSGNFGDNQQAFWLTASQNDWSLGQQQRYLRLNDTDSVRKAWSVNGVDAISVPGQTTLRYLVSNVNTSTSGSVSGPYAACPNGVAGIDPHIYADSNSLYTVSVNGTVTNRGAHTAGQPSLWGMCTDGDFIYLSGASGINKVSTTSYSNTATSFSSTTNAGALCFNDNQLYSCDGTSLNVYSSTGVKTNVASWTDATSTPYTGSAVKIIPFGGTVLIFFPQLGDRPQLWQYDGTGVSEIADLPPSVIGGDIMELDGTVYLTGVMNDPVAYNGVPLDVVGLRPIVYYYNGGTVGELWRSSTSGTVALLGENIYFVVGPYKPSLGAFAGRVLFTDPGESKVNEYDPGTGGISTVGSYSLVGHVCPPFSSTPHSALLVQLQAPNTKGAQLYPNTQSYASSAVLQSSLIDFESSLPKEFHGIKAVWSGGAGTSVDIAWTLNDLGTFSNPASYTTLQVGAVSDTEYALPNGTVGNSLSYQITLHQSSDQSQVPILKRVYVRGAPVLDVFRSNEYILDLTGIGIEDPVHLNNDMPHQLSGFEQAQNLMAAIQSQASFSVTDKLGTFTAMADVPNCSIFEWREGNDSPEFPGCYVAQISVRQVY